MVLLLTSASHGLIFKLAIRGPGIRFSDSAHFRGLLTRASEPERHDMWRDSNVKESLNGHYRERGRTPAVYNVHILHIILSYV